MRTYRVQYKWKGTIGYWEGQASTTWGATDKAKLAAGCDPENRNDILQWENIRIWQVQEDGALLELGAMYTDSRYKEV